MRLGGASIMHRLSCDRRGAQTEKIPGLNLQLANYTKINALTKPAPIYTSLIKCYSHFNFPQKLRSGLVS